MGRFYFGVSSHLVDKHDECRFQYFIYLGQVEIISAYYSSMFSLKIYLAIIEAKQKEKKRRLQSNIILAWRLKIENTQIIESACRFTIRLRFISCHPSSSFYHHVFSSK